MTQLADNVMFLFLFCKRIIGTEPIVQHSPADTNYVATIQSPITKGTCMVPRILRFTKRHFFIIPNRCAFDALLVVILYV